MNAKYTYLILLICLILLCLFFAVIYSNKRTSNQERKFISIFLVIGFSLLITFRPDNIPDTEIYKQIFYNIKINVSYGFDIFGEAENVEYGFLYLIKIFKFFSNDVRLFFFTVCLLSVSLFLFGIKKIVVKLTGLDICVPIVLAVYISYFGIYYNGIAIRQGLAMALCTLSFAYFLNKKYIRCILFWLLAFICHRLSFILLFILVAYSILRHFKISGVIYYFIVLLCLMSGLFGIGYLINKNIFWALEAILDWLGLTSSYGHYISNYASQRNGFPLYLVFYSFCGLIMVYLVNKKRALKNLLNIYLVGIILMNLLVGVETISRGLDYLIVFSLLIISCLTAIGKRKVVTMQKNNGYIQYRCSSNQVYYKTRTLLSFNSLLIALFVVGSFLIVINIIYPDLMSLNFLH